ncbi:unnamed protein product [Oncorhynchus mykiss]|uniref:Uncharacterized protein n=1 Tax=Oncorhynchus mykiss TaxID=8022 RepID=A0A060YEJ9_ONCMY|nr:unnamed protein product [Oncorhynchus mykiss]
MLLENGNYRRICLRFHKALILMELTAFSAPLLQAHTGPSIGHPFKDIVLTSRHHTMTDLWQNAMDHAVALARKAGSLVRDAVQNDMKVMLKSSSVDLVTKTDQKVEQLIIDSVKEKFPTHRYNNLLWLCLYKDIS